MRTELIEAVLYGQRNLQNIGSNNISMEEISQRLYATVDQMYALMACFNTLSMVKSEIATTTSCSIQWNVADEYLVLELSTTSPFVAIFFYGIPPAIVLDHVMHCIQIHNLVPLTQAEIDDLDEQGLYHYLF